MREAPRIRRLRSDWQALERLRDESSIFTFECSDTTHGPPHEYRLRFCGMGVWRPAHNAQVLPREHHEVAVRLGANYPRSMPEIAWQTPIFHPNISTSGVVCLGGYGSFWTPSLHLDELCHMLWDMVRYTNYDVKSPYNREAAHWARTQTSHTFPLDPRPLRDRARVGGSTDTGAESAPARPAPEILFLGDVIDSRLLEEIVDAEVVEEPREILIIE